MEQNTPNQQEQVAVDSRSPIARTYREAVEHMQRNNRTLKEEYELVQAKKSGLSKRLREFIILMYEVETATKEELPLDPKGPSPISE